MALLRLEPPIPLQTPKGNGWAHIMIDRSQEHDIEWVCFIDETRECWTFRNNEVKIQKNITMGREK